MTAEHEPWARHDREWRDPAEIVSLWADAPAADPSLLRFTVRGDFWDAVERTRGTLFVTREYEHLVLALGVEDGRPKVSYLSMPHPSGLVVDRRRRSIFVASTRNPNQILRLAPVTGERPRADVDGARPEGHPLVPVAVRFYPGSTYLHDLALIGGTLHANAVGENSVVRVGRDGRLHRVFWPKSLDTDDGPRIDRNYLQLNSIAAGGTLRTSYFSASTERPGRRRPGHRDFPVRERGVIFSGRTREPVVSGLTRPHSARLHLGRLWVANSGYGEIGVARRGRFEAVRRFDGWTRGLAFVDDVGFAGTSRVIPRFRRYAPGLDVQKSRCAIHAFRADTGETLGTLTWPAGNQIFAIDWAPREITTGLPFSLRDHSRSARAKRLFYAFQTGD